MLSVHPLQAPFPFLPTGISAFVSDVIVHCLQTFADKLEKW